MVDPTTSAPTTDPTSPTPQPWEQAATMLAEQMAGFELRDGQRQMMQAVAEAIDDGRDLIVEAGTGTGKTLAYLLPALAAGKRMVVATATRQLQGQIVSHDMKLALAAIGDDRQVAVLKGRSNYLCHERLEKTLGRSRSRGVLVDEALHHIAAVARSSEDGDIAEIEDVAERDPIWPDVTSTADNCLGAECPHYEDCFVVRARRRALAADVVIVNHHLLLSDYALRERWDGASLLPAVDVIVIDEAHALEDVATRFFGATVSRARVDRQLGDLRRLCSEHPEGADVETIRAVCDEVEAAATTLWRALRDELGTRYRDTQVGPQLMATLDEPVRGLSEVLVRLAKTLESAGGSDDAAWQGAPATALALREDLGLLLATPEAHLEDPLVRWVEVRDRGAVAVRGQPVHVGTILERTLLAEQAVRVFTSATLSVGSSALGGSDEEGGSAKTTRFGHLRERLGLADTAAELLVGSPFDYRRQALVYVPEGIPEPNRPGRDEAVADVVERLVLGAHGGAFVLFSSWRAMLNAAERLDGRLPMTILRQGDMGRDKLLGRFKEAQPAVLFATMGFWQGVDVPGDDLRLVILDKLPFPPPDDPLFAARARRVEEEPDAQGRRRSSFQALSVPMATIHLRQGFGRLIRSQRDWGVVAILDPRLVSRAYGRRMVGQLPRASRTRQLGKVLDFLQRRMSDSDGESVADGTSGPKRPATPWADVYFAEQRAASDGATTHAVTEEAS
jgi:ATP-dependent DNA helicase DinG